MFNTALQHVCTRLISKAQIQLECTQFWRDCVMALCSDLAPPEEEEEAVIMALQREWQSDSDPERDECLSVEGSEAESNVTHANHIESPELKQSPGLVPIHDDMMSDTDISQLIILDVNQIRWELDTFLKKHWQAVRHWEYVIQNRMKEAFKSVPPLQWGPGKLDQWPCDAKPVYEIHDGDFHIRLYLGSIAAAFKVDEIQDDLHLVISMNDQDDKTKGEPSDWVDFFAGRRLKNLRYLGWDETNINWYDNWDRWFEKIVEFIFIWNSMVLDFVQSHKIFRSQNPQKTFSVLVHCYGGINRSGAATFCLVILLENLSLEEALEKSLLLKAPEKQYWIRRNYFIPALLFFQHLNGKHLKPAPANSTY